MPIKRLVHVRLGELGQDQIRPVVQRLLIAERAPGGNPYRPYPRRAALVQPMDRLVVAELVEALDSPPVNASHENPRSARNERP
ncbi:Uncharacterised protein [Mycobacteroides abscessus subsp. abscessus]|nr:Uncharacterised protein [Mycobacteroides abscessus subsp. abscessus]